MQTRTKFFILAFFAMGIPYCCFAADTVSKLVIVSDSFTAAQDNVSAQIAVEAQDNTGVKNDSFNETADLYTSSPGGRFSVAAVPWSDTTVITLSSGSAVFYYKDSQTGTPTITVFRTGLFPDTQVEIINDSFFSETQSSADIGPDTIPANGVSACTISILIRNSYGNPLSGRQVTVSASRGIGIDTVTQPVLTDVNGQCTGTVVSSSFGTTTITIVCEGDTIADSAVMFTASKLRFISVVQGSLERGFCSESFTFEAIDGTDTRDILFNETVTVSSASAAGLFSSDSSSWSADNTLALDLTSGFGYFYYKDTTNGSYTIIISRLNWVSDSQTQLVTDTLPPDPPSNLTVSMLPLYKIQLNWQASDSEDIDNYNVYWDSATGSVNYDTPLVSVMHPAVTWTSDTLSVVDTAYIFALRAQDLTGNLETNTNITVSVTMYETRVSDTQSSVLADPAVAKADGVSACTASIFIKDASGDPVQGRYVTMFTSRGAAADVIVQPDNVTDANGQCTATVRSSCFGTSTITVFCDWETFSGPVISFTASKLAFTSAAETLIERGVASATITIEARDDTGIKVSSFNDTVLIVSSSSTGRFSSDNTAWSSANTLVITFISGYGYIHYKDTVTGTAVLTVSRSGIAPDSQTAGVTDTIPPDPPSDLTLVLLDMHKIRLQWTKSGSDDAAEYRVYWDSATGIVDYANTVACVVHPDTMWTSDTLTFDTAYRFVVRTKDITGNIEANTNVIAATIYETLSGVKAIVKVPQSGKVVSGGRLTVIAEPFFGSVLDVANIRFEYRPAVDTEPWQLIPAYGAAYHPNPDPAFPYFIHWDVSSETDGDYHIRAVATDVQGESDTDAVYFTITIGDTDPDIEENVNALGDHEKRDRVYTGHANTVKVGGGTDKSLTEVSIPEGAINASTRLLVSVLNPSNAPGRGVQYSFRPVNEYRVFALESGQVQLSGGKQASITIPYSDEDNNGIVDGTDIPEALLSIYYYDPSDYNWKAGFTTTVDAVNNKCSAEVGHFSTFGIFAAGAYDLGRVIVYPNPFEPNSGLGHTVINFDNLPADAAIRIFTITGNLVFRVDNVTSKYEWNVKNTGGRNIASGVYVYIVTDNAGNKRTGKFAVIK